EQRRHTGRAQAAARTLLEIVNDLLDFSKIEAQRLDLEQIALNLDQIVCQVSSACALNATRKNLEFVIDVDPQTPRDLFGDPLRLTQVLVNLVGNAIKFSDKGHVVLRVEPEMLDLPGSARLRFEVEDTGIGLDDQQKTLIFEPFVQGDSTMSRRYGGTGLGLAICKRLVELMGGKLSVESEPQRGSVFSFSLNFDGVVAGPLLEPWGLGARVLLLEPSQQQARALCRLLEAHAASVELTSDSKNALQAFEDQRGQGAGFDLVLMDESAADAEGDFAALLARSAELGTPHALLRNAGASVTGDTPGLTKPWEASALVELTAQLLGGPKRLAAPPAPQLRQEPLHGKRVLVV
ncbi:MAG TPA: ATP-binding protein, partial [Polyangiales bacterium]|nr:ATP-binding protein [Polyangiales bacterium]